MQLARDESIEYLITDSRKILSSPRSLFFAISGVRNNGHDHIASAYEQGIRQFVVEQGIDVSQFPTANFMKADSSIGALQKLASIHRDQFSYPVIGITGSNGKTIVKEWLFQLLSSNYKCVKNPGSYNSQVGVPRSVWQMSDQHELGIFEAGISKPGEMAVLQKIIQPTIGLFTSLGTAHDEGFGSTRDKLNEKLTLFKNCKTLIYCTDHTMINETLANWQIPGQQRIGWGQKTGSDILLEFNNNDWVSFTGLYGGLKFKLPFDDKASKENLLHCMVMLLHFGFSPSSIQEKIDQLESVPMRLQLKQGINQCQIVDDTYNNDLGGLRIALEFLEGVNLQKKTLILSDVLQSGITLDELSKQIVLLLKEKQIQKFVGIGFGFHAQQKAFDDIPIDKKFYLTTEDFIREINWDDFSHEAILIKGARVFQFEKIVQLLQKKVHGTVMEIDLGAMVHNLNYFRSLLQPGVKLMVMVKAFAYGSGSNEIASLLQYHRVDYLGVAYVDEGVDLRNHQINLPIMVMNPSEDSWALMIERKLEPEIYSINLLKSLIEYLDGSPCLIHLKIDTGMHRLGFESKDLNQLTALLVANPNVKIASIFSHLAGADESGHDDFSKQQAEAFDSAVSLISGQLQAAPIKHLLNSSGILRFSTYQYDMVRLGIGLYGIDPSGAHQHQLKLVATLKTVVSQVKKVTKGDSIGYSRMGRAAEAMTIATIAIGYADGYSRVFGKGIGKVLIHGIKAPVVGNVCMDMTMIDITAIPNVKEGDEVIIFGDGNSIIELAEQAHTIPYEILTNTSERVKRVFFAESI